MAKAFKKKGNPTEAIPVATTVEKVGDTEYGVADKIITSLDEII